MADAFNEYSSSAHIETEDNTDKPKINTLDIIKLLNSVI